MLEAEPPLEGMVQQSLLLVSEYPLEPNPPYYYPKFWVKLEVEFENREAAERLEEKIRTLLRSDKMYVVKVTEVSDV